MVRQKEVFFIRASIGGLILSIFGIYLALRSQKTKEEFNYIHGEITYLEKTFETYKNSKTRFLKVGDYPLAFSIFIGHDTGDFSPKYENIDGLKKGDDIYVYYDELPLQRNDTPELNKGVQFIEKNGKLYYERGSKDKYFGYFIIPVGLILSVISFMIVKGIIKIKDK